MWQKLTRTSKKYDLQSEITSFVSIDGTTEIQLIKITNLSEEEQEVTPIVILYMVLQQKEMPRRSFIRLLKALLEREVLS